MNQNFPSQQPEHSPEHDKQSGHAHDHGTGVGKKRLIIAIAIIGVFLIVQVLGAIFSGSLSLLADAGHMSSDLIGLIVALVATVVAAKPATDRHTFGFRRFEVFGALINGVILSVVAVGIGAEGIRRLLSGELQEVQSIPMLIVAVIGLVANIAALLVLRGGAGESINLRGAYLEVMADTLGSVAVIAAALVMTFTGFVEADAIASLLIAAMILPRTFMLLRDVFRVLSQSAPRETDTQLIREHILGQPGVRAIHDLHIWQITTGSPVFTVHLSVDNEVFEENRVAELLAELNSCLRQHFDVEHSTFQLEPVGYTEPPSHS